jgi:hypothetical protein
MAESMDSATSCDADGNCDEFSDWDDAVGDDSSDSSSGEDSSDSDSSNGDE